MFGYQPSQKRAIDATCDVVARGNREEGPRVVVKPDSIVEAGCLGDLLAKAHHPLRRVVEPPSRTEFQRRIVTGQRSQLTGVGRLVQRKENEGQTRVVSVLVEQRP